MKRPRRSTTARGYGHVHQTIRARWTPKVAAGRVRCARGPACKRAELVDGQVVGGLILPTEPWDLGHDDHDRSRWTGPEHQACNRATSKPRPRTREW